MTSLTLMEDRRLAGGGAGGVAAVWDLQTRHSSQGYTRTDARVEKSVIWSLSPSPDNNSVMMATLGSGAARLVQFKPPGHRVMIGRDGTNVGTPGELRAGAGHQWVHIMELRLRADTSSCRAARSAVLPLPGQEDRRRYLDCGLVVVQAEVRLLLLGERRNKERFCSVVEVLTSGQARLQLGRELAVYDKASMLGKQLTHLATSSNQGAECEVFTCGNLIRYYTSYSIIVCEAYLYILMLYDS